MQSCSQFDVMSRELDGFDGWGKVKIPREDGRERIIHNLELSSFTM